MAERDYRKPPPDKEVPRRVLWRQLLGRPRPSKTIRYRHPLAPALPLTVVAMRGPEDAEVFDSADVNELLRSSFTVAKLISKTLWTPTQRAFSSPEDVLRMTTAEVTRLGNAVFETLSEVSPVYYRCDESEWKAALIEGVRHPTNQAEAVAMYHCCDFSGKGTPIPRPTVYFGLPAIELTDGHRMAFAAALDWVKQVSGTSD